MRCVYTVVAGIRLQVYKNVSFLSHPWCTELRLFCTVVVYYVVGVTYFFIMNQMLFYGYFHGVKAHIFFVISVNINTRGSYGKETNQRTDLLFHFVFFFFFKFAMEKYLRYVVAIYVLCIMSPCHPDASSLHIQAYKHTCTWISYGNGPFTAQR